MYSNWLYWKMSQLQQHTCAIKIYPNTLFIIYHSLSSSSVSCLPFPLSIVITCCHFHLFSLSLVFSEGGVCVRLCPATEPSPYQLWGSWFLQDEGPISKPRQGQGSAQEVIRLWGGGRQRLYFNMSETNLQQKPVDEPHAFSFRKATKGESNGCVFIYIRGCTCRSCLTAKYKSCHEDLL